MATNLDQIAEKISKLALAAKETDLAQQLNSLALEVQKAAPIDPTTNNAQSGLMLAAGAVVVAMLLALGAVVIWLMFTGKINLKNVIANADGDASLSRFQFLIFTFVIASCFLVITLNQLKFPELSATVLGLLGLSGASYLIGKGIGDGAATDPKLVALKAAAVDSDKKATDAVTAVGDIRDKQGDALAEAVRKAKEASDNTKAATAETLKRVDEIAQPLPAPS